MILDKIIVSELEPENTGVIWIKPIKDSYEQYIFLNNKWVNINNVKEIFGTVSSVNNQAPDSEGNINITKEDIGLENVDNTADEDKIVKGAIEDGSGNVITTTYETKIDATTKQTALQEAIANLTGLDSNNFGGFSIQSTEADAISNIATLYTADGYTDELLWYMAGTSLSSVKAYRYNGSGTPIAISSDSYNCVDFSGLIADVSTLRQDLDALGHKIDGTLNGEMLTLSKINADGIISSTTATVNLTLKVDVSQYVGQHIRISGVLYAAKDTYCWYSIHDADGTVLEKSPTSNGTLMYLENWCIRIPDESKYLYIQGSSTSARPSAELWESAISAEILSASHPELRGWNKVSVPDYVLNWNIINGSGLKINQNTTGIQSYGYNVHKGEKYYICANSEHAAYIHLLNSLDTAYNKAPTYMAGAGRLQVGKGKYVVVDIPSEGYLVVMQGFYQAAPTDYVPSAVIKMGESIFDNELCYTSLIGTTLVLKKIDGDGNVLDSTTETNRTLAVNVADYIGQTLRITGRLFTTTSTNSYCWWAVHDAGGNVLSKSATATSAEQHTNEPLTIPDGAAMLYVQGTVLYPPLAKASVNSVVSSLARSSETSVTTTRTFGLEFPCLSGSSGKLAVHTSWTNKYCQHTPEYMRVHKTICIKNLGGNTLIIRVFFYDSSFAMIGNPSYQDTANGLDTIVVEDIPANAVWFRISLAINNADFATAVGYSRQDIDIESEWGDDEPTAKEPYIEYNPFIYPVKVNIPMKIASNPSIVSKTVFAFDEGLLHLPSSYTPQGKPTPVIFYLHGDAERYVIGESTFSGHMKMQQCWSDAGFAQVDLDMIPSCYNNTELASTGGTRDDLECLSAAWRFLKAHYNIDDRGFYLIGRSRGGQAVLEILGKGGAIKLPIIATVSMAGANSIFEYSVYSPATEAEWQLWCNAHGLPTTGRPTWQGSSGYATTRSFLYNADIYNFVSSNFELWWRKALTGWGLISKNDNGITPRAYFDRFVYPFVQAGRTYTTDIEAFFSEMLETMEAKSPVPLRLDWCVGDQTQNRLPFDTTKSYSSVVSEILLKTPGSLTEYRQWDGVDASNPYSETDPHYAENMIFYDGDLTLPNGKVTSNPSKVAMEWLIWCMGKDARYQGMDYTLPWQ